MEAFANKIGREDLEKSQKILSVEYEKIVIKLYNVIEQKAECDIKKYSK